MPGDRLRAFNYDEASRLTYVNGIKDSQAASVQYLTNAMASGSLKAGAKPSKLHGSLALTGPDLHS